MSTKPTTFTETARRTQIVRAAVATVNEIGYPHASLSAIARHAGVAKSAILYYFDSKDALLEHACDAIFGELYMRLERAVGSESEPARQLLAYATTYLDYVNTHRAEITAGMEIMISHRGPDGIPLYLAGTDEDTALLRGVITDGIASGVFRPIDPRIAVGIVESLLDFASTEVQRDPEGDLTALNEEIITVLSRGLAPTSSYLALG